MNNMVSMATTTCCPLPILDPIEQRAFFVSKIRSTFTTLVYTVQSMGLLGVLIACFGFSENWLDGVSAIILLTFLVPHFLAIYHSGCSDHTLIFMTQAYQSCFTILAVLRIFFTLVQTLKCPAMTGTRLQSFEQTNCTVTDMNVYHADARGSVITYSVTVLNPIILMLNNIPVKTVILPLTLILSLINVYIVITFVPLNDLIPSLMFPLFAGASVLAIGYRVEFQALKMWQERLHYVKQQDAWMATVAHNIGTPLTTMSFAISAMTDLKPSKDIRFYLKQQRVAVDYLRSVYTTVMYRRGGKTPILKQQRFKLTDLIAACEDMTKTYGHSLLNISGGRSDVIIQYTHDSKLPIHMVSDWAKIQQCVVNLVSNAQKHVHNFVKQHETNLPVHINVNVVNVKFLLDETQHQLRIEVSDACSVGVNNAAVSNYLKMEGTGLGSVALLVESMNGLCGGFQNSSSGRLDLGERGSTFFIALPLQDNVAVRNVHV